MANFQLNWVPGFNANSINQIPYRIAKANGVTPNIAGATLSSSANSYLWTSLNTNTIYRFKIVNNCTLEGPVSSNIYEWIEFECISLLLESISTTAAELRGILPNPTPVDGGASIPNYTDIDNYEFTLYNAANSVLISGPTLGTVIPMAGETFISYAGLTPNTTYTVRYVMLATVNGVTVRSDAATQLGTYCQQQFTTDSAFCPVPTGVYSSCASCFLP